MYNTIKLEIKNRIACITINRPEALNAINMEAVTEIYDALLKVNDENLADVVILTGEGRAFAAGADIAYMKNASAVEGREFAVQGHRLANYMEDMPKPIIAAINGYSFGGGNELALACDIRIASTKAVIGQPEVTLGVCTGWGASRRLPRLIGEGKAKYLILTGERLTGQQAFELGIVEKVVEPEELMDAAYEIAEKIAANGPFAVGLAKTVINVGYNMDMNSYSKLEQEMFGQCFSTYDQKEGMDAFVNKRKAKFQGK